MMIDCFPEGHHWSTDPTSAQVVPAAAAVPGLEAKLHTKQELDFAVKPHHWKHFTDTVSLSFLSPSAWQP